MTTQLKGYGRLFSQQRWIDEVEFEVNLHNGPSTEGHLWSLEPDLPLSPSALDLDTREGALRVRLELLDREFDRRWNKYKYELRCLFWRPASELEAAPAREVGQWSVPVPAMGN